MNPDVRTARHHRVTATPDGTRAGADAAATRLISVVIPCYQEEKFISSCLASVRAFTLPAGWDMEILVVDGDSRDATRQLVTDFVNQDRRVRLLDNPRRTQSSGLNIGIQASKGEYILRLDA